VIPGRHVESECGDFTVQDETVDVSVIVPCLNEERFIGKTLENLANQHDHERYEIIVVDGMSRDNTRKVISEFSARNPRARLRLVANPAKSIPVGLNLGIRQASGQIIVRMDAHSVPSPNYVRQCVKRLSDPGVSVVGMPWRIQPGAETLTARAIAMAVAHPFGVGDAKYRMRNPPGVLPSILVPFGAYRKSLWQKLGAGETLLTNEDYDFNYRARCSSGQVILDPSGHCTYYARPTLRALARQYARYGTWKARMLKMHPTSIRLRQAVPPSFVGGVMLLGALSPWVTAALWMALFVVTIYAALAFTFGLRLSRRVGDFRLALLVSMAFFVIHWFWGGGFLWGVVRLYGRPSMAVPD
jgi:cellulose synthase/poly-beta-1,6-N-acetylglucosamine synthase-like glycosyltransferase